MPFVVVHSKDGPYEDQAYAAGWEAGRLDATLTLTAHVRRGVGVAAFDATVRTDNLPQIDLIAMAHDLSTTVLSEGDGWTQLVMVSADP